MMKHVVSAIGTPFTAIRGIPAFGTERFERSTEVTESVYESTGILYHTVDGRNPAPVDMENLTLFFIGFHR